MKDKFHTYERRDLYEFLAIAMSHEDMDYALKMIRSPQLPDQIEYDSDSQKFVLKDILPENCKLCFTKGELIKEMERRNLPLPLPVHASPKNVIFKTIDVKQKSKMIIMPDTENTKNNFDLFDEHPLQGIVVALDPTIDWEDLELGSRIYLKSNIAEIFRFNNVNYRFINYSGIIACD